MTTVDLNGDVGEGFGHWALGDDDAMLEVLTSANVACGFHGGDPRTMRRVCAVAADNGVTIGAQVGYRDLVGFGRRFIDVASEELTADVFFQIAALDGFAQLAGTRVRYVKPHGALYNAMFANASQAAAVVEAVRSWDPAMPVLGLPDSQWLRQASAAGLPTVSEAFVDRAYTSSGTLVRRGEPGAVLLDPDEVAARSVEMVVNGRLVADDGSTLSVVPQSLCVHGDTPGAVELARRVRTALRDSGVDLQPFAKP
jgi:UPF0271 protein